MMKKNYFFTLLIIGFFVFSSDYSLAQKMRDNQKTDDDQAIELLKKKHTPGFFGVTFTNVVAQDEFQTALQKSDVGAGQGFSIYGGYIPEQIPIAIGGDIDFIFWKSTEKRNKYGSFPYIYDTTTVSNNSIPINVFVRFQPNIMGWVFPYAEGFAGLTIYSSSLDYKSNYSTLNQNETESDVSWNYGVGAGVMVKMVEFIELPSKKSTLNLDVRARYSLGSETEFQVKEILNNNIITNKFEAKTNTFSLSVGIVFLF